LIIYGVPPRCKTPGLFEKIHQVMAVTWAVSLKTVGEALAKVERKFKKSWKKHEKALLQWFSVSLEGQIRVNDKSFLQKHLAPNHFKLGRTFFLWFLRHITQPGALMQRISWHRVWIYVCQLETVHICTCHIDHCLKCIYTQ
jgi:hypothetical protein